MKAVHPTKQNRRTSRTSPLNCLSVLSPNIVFIVQEVGIYCTGCPQRTLSAQQNQQCLTPEETTGTVREEIRTALRAVNALETDPDPETMVHPEEEVEEVVEVAVPRSQNYLSAT